MIYTIRMGNSKSKTLSKRKLEDLNKRTKFSSEEIREWYTKFQNEYPNGKISETEFIDMYSEMFPKGDAKRFARHAFRAYDIDGDGVIDFQEFLTTMSISSKGSTREKLGWAFHMYDINGNGTVSRTEIMKILLSIYRLHGDYRTAKAEDTAKLIFLSLDKDQNGELTKEEFIIGAQQAGITDILKGP